ncbi:MAG: glycerate kinase type-2 family protein [Gemmatimonadota bacterium]
MALNDPASPGRSASGLHIRRIFDDAVRAADPEPGTRRLVQATTFADANVSIIALGKAALAMTRGALAGLDELGIKGARTIAVTVEGAAAPPDNVELYFGEHPVPGRRSAQAAEAIGQFVSSTPAGASVFVLLSGGTSSLVAAPAPGFDEESIVRLNETLLSSGAPIQVVNAFRRRVLRWAGGRLRHALGDADVHVLALSDVLGDDFASIGSGPCSPDPTTASGLLELAERYRMKLPQKLAVHLRAVGAGELPETLKPESLRLDRTTFRIVAGNAVAARAAADAARATLPRDATVIPAPPIVGEARLVGQSFARRALELAGAGRPGALVAGGEPTVTLVEPTGSGGRCQEFALAAALELAHAEAAITILAAGTDGRDGPTDAAGAAVDSRTVALIRAAGLDPLLMLDRHDSGTALDAAGALLRTGPTGTNVNDIFVALIGP